jgi:hypothetical protein
VRLLSSLIALSLAACQPAFERRASQVDGPRFLAVRAEPAEAAAGATVALTALLVDESGPVLGPAPSWAFCLANRPAADDNTVADACLDDGSPALRPLAAGPGALEAAGALPLEGCQVFGSEPPPPGPGEPPVRPQDPDASGGYYQPVRVEWPGGGRVAFGQVRLACALPSAPAAVVQDFRARYQRNQNPRLLGLRGAATVAPGERVALTAEWASDAAEQYVSYDLARVALADRAEVLRLSWFATLGALEADASGPLEGTEAAVGWRAPDAPGTVHLWAVLRDDRGGMDWRHLALEVR